MIYRVKTYFLHERIFIFIECFPTAKGGEPLFEYFYIWYKMYEQFPTAKGGELLAQKITLMENTLLSTV